MCRKNQFYSAIWWYKPRSVEVIWILLIFSFLFAQSDSKPLCTYLWPDNGDMRPSSWFLGYVHLFYPLLLKSEHFSYYLLLICLAYYTVAQKRNQFIQIFKLIVTYFHKYIHFCYWLFFYINFKIPLFSEMMPNFWQFPITL